MACALLAKWIVREGHEEEVAEAIRALIEPTRSEPGNLFYRALPLVETRERTLLEPVGSLER